jgi:hypothetical protein
MQGINLWKKLYTYICMFLMCVIWGCRRPGFSRQQYIKCSVHHSAAVLHSLVWCITCAAVPQGGNTGKVSFVFIPGPTFLRERQHNSHTRNQNSVRRKSVSTFSVCVSRQDLERSTMEKGTVAYSWRQVAPNNGKFMQKSRSKRNTKRQNDGNTRETTCHVAGCLASAGPLIMPNMDNTYVHAFKSHGPFRTTYATSLNHCHGKDC